jgi:hypothetical protein
MCLAAGFQIEEFKYTQGAPQWTVSVLTAMHRKGWLGLPKNRENILVAMPFSQILLVIFAAFDLVLSKFFPTSQMFFVLRKPT